VQSALDRLWPELSPLEVLVRLFSSPDRLAAATPDLSDDDRKSLLDSHGPGFTAADAPLLDELAELLGVDDAEERERARRRWRAQIEDAQGALDILTGSAPQDLEDELDPEILMAYDLIDASQLAERQNAGTRLTTVERAAGDRTWTYGHVIVDEAQELSEMAWRMVMRRIPNRWITVVGDVSQTGDPAGTTSWNRILEPYVAQRWKLSELTVNYRTPAEIMDSTREVLQAIDPDATLPRSVRESGTQPWADHVDAGDLTERVRGHVAAVTVPGQTAVIAPPEIAAELADLSSETVSVLSVRAAKGLEFDTVFIVEPQQILDESARGLSDLYVAMTRATQRLGVIHARPLPAVLKNLAEPVRTAATTEQPR